MEEQVPRGVVDETGEWAKSEARDFADAVRQRAQESRRDLKDYATHAKEYARGAIQETRVCVDGAREYLGDAVQQARDTVVAYHNGGMDRVRQDVVGYTRQQPMTALLIAAAAGLILGWLCAVGRR